MRLCTVNIRTRQAQVRERHEHVLPARPEMAQRDPEQPIADLKGRMWALALKHRDLLTEREDLQSEIGAGPHQLSFSQTLFESRMKRNRDHSHAFGHALLLARLACLALCHSSASVSV